MNDDPEALVIHAVAEKTPTKRVWCVFDKDEFTDESIYRAIDIAKKYDIGIAFSNSAFEVWLIDHFRQCKTEKTNSQLTAEIDALLKTSGNSQGYAKKDSDVIRNIFVPRLDDAIQNADIVCQKYVREYRDTGRKDNDFPVCTWNSYTDVHKLVIALRLERR